MIVPRVSPNSTTSASWRWSSAAGRHVAVADAMRMSRATPASTTARCAIIRWALVARRQEFHASAGFGPWLVTADEIRSGQAVAPDPAERRGGPAYPDQRSHFRYPDDHCLFFVFMPLVPGDTISTGTPGRGRLRAQSTLCSSSRAMWSRSSLGHRHVPQYGHRRIWLSAPLQPALAAR